MTAIPIPPPTESVVDNKGNTKEIWWRYWSQLSDSAASSSSAVTNRVHVKDYPYNAVGDGVAGDSDAIQAALNSGAGQIEFSGGTYKLDKALVIPSDVTLYAAPGTAALYMPTTMDVSGALTIAATIAAIGSQNTSNVSLYGLEIYGDGATQTQKTVMMFDTVTGLRLEKCYIHTLGNGSYYNQGFYIIDCDGARVRDVDVDDCSGDCAAIVESDDIWVDGSSFTNSDDWGLAVVGCRYGKISNCYFANNQTGSGFSECTGLSFVNCKSSGNGYGFRAADFGASSVPHERGMILGWESVGDTDYGISVEVADHTVVAGCSVDDGGSIGIHIATCDNCVVVGNMVRNCDDENIRFISFSGSSDNNIIAGNVSYGSTFGIRQLSGGGAFGVNKIYGNVATGAATANFSGTFDTPLVQADVGDPAHSAPKGTLYVKTDATTTTTRLWVNTDGSTTWAYFTSSA